VVLEGFLVGKRVGGDLYVSLEFKDAMLKFKGIVSPLPSGGGPIILFPGADMSPFLALILF
jgi:hypothetical protein